MYIQYWLFFNIAEVAQSKSNIPALKVWKYHNTDQSLEQPEFFCLHFPHPAISGTLQWNLKYPI